MALLLGKGGIIRETEDLETCIDGFDTLSLTRIVIGASTARQALVIARFATGRTAESYAQMYCMRATAKFDKGQAWECRAEYKGIALSNKPYKRTVRTFPDKSRGTLTAMGLDGPYAQEVEINESTVGVTVNYILDGIPPTSRVSYNATPPVGTVAVPASRWAVITNPLQTIPDGWVLDGLEAEQLPGTPFHLVREDYVFYQRFKPGSNSFA